VFGPITLLWFLTLAVLGVSQILRQPDVLAAASPHHAVRFLAESGWRGFVVLGSVFLVVTGGEALYADLGHFGRRPTRVAWFVVVLPALLLNYFGQGALLIRDPAAVVNPFYRMAPSWALYPVVAIATAATVIASQALISGAYSLTMHAVQLGYIPRVTIEHTSARERGQIYVPAVNWLLMAACIGLVIGFGSSSRLAAAYGVAVTTTMAITTLLFYVVARKRWRWRAPVALAVTGFFLTFDLAFLGANLLKIPHGGWFPLVAGCLIFGLMTTWRRGRHVLLETVGGGLMPIDDFLRSLALSSPHRVRGTAIFLYGNPDATPPALLHNLKHNQVLHERVVLLAVETEEVPHVDPDERVSLEHLGQGFHRVIMRFGFMEEPDVPAGLGALRPHGLEFKPLETTYFLSRETLVRARASRMAAWRRNLFAVMARNARTASSFFQLPPNRVVELGAQIEL
jgi:KUP system potassium uptake protein